jgi:hypothetical protein
MKFCQTCLDFLNRFAAKTEQLLGATSDMAGVAGVGGKSEVFEAARREVQRLLTERDTVKAEMTRHQSEHTAMPDISAVHSVCNTCNALLKSLRDASRRLDDSILRLRSFTCTGRAELFHAALFESQSLNRECDALRGKAQHHKAEH